MDLGLHGKVAVVTGASKGIGLAIVRAFLNEGASVVTGARSSSPEMEALAGTGQFTFIPVDLSGPDGGQTLITGAGARVDILVNNVGAASTRTEGFLSIKDDQWAASLNLNFLAAMRTTRAVLPEMLRAGGGTIVNVASVNAFRPDPDVMNCSAAKTALWNFAKSLSKAYGRQGIRVNCISSWPVKGPATRRDQPSPSTAA